MIQFLIFSTLFQHFTLASGILNSQEVANHCDLNNLAKRVKVSRLMFHLFLKITNLFDSNFQSDNDSLPALLSTSGDSMLSSQYLRVTLKSFLPISKFIIKAVRGGDGDLKGISISSTNNKI